MIIVAIAAAILVCVFVVTMLSCSGSAIASDERSELDGVPSEELATTEEDQNADAADAMNEEATVDDVSGSAREVAAVGGSDATGSSASAVSTSHSAPAASTPVSTSKSSGTTAQNVQSTSQGHTHDWYAVKTPQTVVDQAAWTETQYRTVEREICSVCGEDLTDGDSQGRSINEHGKAHVFAGEGGGFHSAFRQEAVGTIEHPAVTHVEYVVTGYRCSSCGAAK